MDVTLYVYDLSKGLARQYSQAFLGTYIDAVYHTALVFNNIEYFFGRGVQTCLPGTTHHGQPMERIPLGQTQLPIEVILEYLESLKSIYTAESYDLFLHNCNNFSNDFAMFLVGKGIPDHITSLPQTVLNTPFGQMLKPQLDQALRGVTQAEVAPPPQSAPTSTATSYRSLVHAPSNMAQLTLLLEKALDSCAVLFFTSQTCAPCKICYEPYENLAAEFGDKAILVKVDISRTHDIASNYGIRATPTFITLLHGKQLDQWSGADIGKLEANARLLVQMAYPPHPHSQLRLPTLQKEYKAQTYSKIPPLDKVLAKLDASVKNTNEVQGLKNFIQARGDASKAANVAVPDLTYISELLRLQIAEKQPLKVFPLIDLFRLALLDVRVSGFFAEESTAKSLIHSIVARGGVLEVDAESYPYLLTTIQALSNAFTSRLSLPSVLSAPQLQSLVSNGLLAETYPALRAAAANLIFNIAGAHHHEILVGEESNRAYSIQDSVLIEFVVSTIEALNHELAKTPAADKDTVRTLLLAIAMLVYGASKPALEELKDILEAVEAKTTIDKAKSMEGSSGIVQDLLQILP